MALAVCAGAQSWTRHSKSGLTCYAEGAWLSWDPQTISFFGLSSWNRYLRHPSDKKIVLFFRSKVFVLLNRFQASCTLRGSEPKFLLPSTFAFHETPDGVFPRTGPFLANCFESCLVKFPLVSFLQNFFKVPHLGFSVFPFFSCLQNLHFLTTILLPNVRIFPAFFLAVS